MSTTGAVRAPRLESETDIQAAANRSEMNDRVDAVLAEDQIFRRSPRPGQPIPTKGKGRVQLALWSSNLGGSDFVVPPLSGGEAMAYRRKMAYAEVLRRELFELSLKVKTIISVMNSKGGASKTPCACYLATVLDWAIESLIILADVNENNGTTCDLMGVDRSKTAKINWAIDNIDRFDDFEDITSLLARPPQRGTAVRVLSSNVVSKSYDEGRLIKLLMKLKRKCDSMVCDCGNNLSHAGNLSALKAATHLVIPMLDKDNAGLKGVMSTIATYVVTGQADKVRQAFIVVNRVHPSGKPEADKARVMKAFAEAASNLTAEDLIEDLSDEAKESVSIPTGKLDLDFFGITKERVFLVPFDPYIGRLQPAHAESLQIDTLIAYLELLVGIFRQQSAVPDLSSITAAD